ncbi:MAG: hypothetical protein NVSMB19_07600 [Vulcanimicrobiaceae bacterium]
MGVPAAAAHTRAAASAARTHIDAMCARRDARARASEPSRFARIFAPASPQVRWHVADARTLARIARDPDIYSELATVWRDGATVATVSIAVRSLDYRAQTTYCFRVSGALARVDETSSGTTNSDRERRYLDERGAIVGRDSILAPLFPQPNVTLSPDVSPARPDLYRTVRALPFFALLAAPA